MKPTGETGAVSKPRVGFCWECGNRLWGRYHTEMEVEGHRRILHRTCAKNIQKGRREFNPYDGDMDAI